MPFFSAPLPPAEWVTLEDTALLREIVEEVSGCAEVAIDTETDGLDTSRCLPFYWSLAYHRPGKPTRRLAMPIETAEEFLECFADRHKIWIFANAKFDMHMFANIGIDFAGVIADVAVMHGLLYEEESHGLKEMNQSTFGWKWTSFTETFGKVKKSPKPGERTSLDAMREVIQKDLWKFVEYASNDTYGTLCLYDHLLTKLEQAPTYSWHPEDISTLSDYFWRREVPFTRTLFACERNRCQIDLTYLESKAVPIKQGIIDLDKKIWALVGHAINPGSDADLRAYFFDEMHYTPKKFTSGGASGARVPAVDDEVLHALDDEVADLVLERRDLKKTLTTYVQGIVKHLGPDGRVRYRFNQNGAVSGRLSSAGINIQNLKRPDEDKYRIRAAFVARPGYVLIVFDYNALEMRLLAAAADEPAMIQIFKDGKDIHMGNAVLVFGKSLAAKFKREVTYESFLWAKKMDKKIKEAKKDNLPLPCSQEDADFCKALMNARLAVKTIGFGLIYGLREKALARRIECTVEEALELTAAFMATYPAIMSFCAEAVASVHEDSFAFTLMGRRRYLPLIHSSRNMDQWRAERQAKNTPIQGTAAEVAAGAMNRIYHEGLEDIFDCKMLFQVHDELVFECREDQADAAYAWIKERMEHPFKQDLSVPLLAEGGIGKNWADAKA